MLKDWIKEKLNFKFYSIPVVDVKKTFAPGFDFAEIPIDLKIKIKTTFDLSDIHEHDVNMKYSGIILNPMFFVSLLIFSPMIAVMIVQILDIISMLVQMMLNIKVFSIVNDDRNGVYFLPLFFSAWIISHIVISYKLGVYRIMQKTASEERNIKKGKFRVVKESGFYGFIGKLK